MKERIENLEKQVDILMKDMQSNSGLKVSIQELQKKTQFLVTQEDINKLLAQIKQIEDELKMNGLEFKNLHLQMEEFQKIKRQVNGLLKCPSENDFNLMKGRMEACEKSDSLMKKTLTEHEKKIKNLKSAGGGGGADAGLIEEFQMEMDKLRQEFEEHRDLSNKELTSHNVQLLNKVSITDLDDVEQRLQQQIDEILQQMILFALKDDVNKRFSSITKKIREILEIIDKNATNDDGMLTKRNLGPIACATCEKDLINLQGMPADYHAWK